MDIQEIPKDDNLLHPAFCPYQSSDQATTLKSEKNRTAFAENFKRRIPLQLANLCLKEIANNCNLHQRIVNQLKPIQLRTFCDFIDENLPIDKCINIDDEFYWKRVFSSKCTDKILLKEKSQQKDICWKNLALSLKYADLIENTPYELWISEEMENITKAVSPFITELRISKLQAMRESSFGRLNASEIDSQSQFSKSTLSSTNDDEQNEDSDAKNLESSTPRYDYPFQDCHHVDLSVFRSLINLNSLTVEFIPPKLGASYHERYFNFSYIDMQNLARGISELTSLRTFKLRRSRMDSVKLSAVLNALQSIFVEYLEFYFCQLDDNCGEALFEYLVSSKSLEHLDLSGNHFRQEAIVYISEGLKASPCQLKYLCLSNNPLSDESLCNLTETLETYEYLRTLKLSGIQTSHEGSLGIAKLVKNNSHLEELQIIAVPMNGMTLIEALKKNHKIQEILCQGCGLTLDEEFKIEILLNRNRYIKENPYVGDVTKTEEEINKFISRTKNPIFLKTLEDRRQRVECSQKKFLQIAEANKLTTD